MAEGTLREVPGIGEAIEKKIVELLTTGHLKYYEDLRAEFPEGVISLLQVPGVGPKTAMRLSTELGVRSMADLEQAIVDGRVAGLFRMGDKTAENILRGLQSMRTKEQRIPIGEALPLAQEIMAALQERVAVRNLTPAGSLRRFRETIGDIDLMGTADDAEAVIEAFTTLPQVREVLARGGTKASLVTRSNLQVDFRVVPDDEYGSLLQYFTGSKQHNISLRERAVRQGLSLSEYGITVVETGRLEKYATEEAFYGRLGLQYIPPEFREGTNEIALAGERKVPEPVKSRRRQGGSACSQQLERWAGLDRGDGPGGPGHGLPVYGRHRSLEGAGNRARPERGPGQGAEDRDQEAERQPPGLPDSGRHRGGHPGGWLPGPPR